MEQHFENNQEQNKKITQQEFDDYRNKVTKYFDAINTILELQEEMKGYHGKEFPHFQIRVNKTSDMKAYRKEYHEKNKDVKRDNYFCDICQCEVLYTSKTQHLKSLKHVKRTQKLSCE